MNPELYISIIAIIISGVTAWYSFRQGRKSNDLQQEQTELQRKVVNLEEQREKYKREAQIRADVKAEVLYQSTITGKKPHKLRIYNEGAGTAEIVRMMINDKPITDCGFILTDQDYYEIIASGSDIKLPMAIDNDSPSNWKTTIYWNDKTGYDKKFETTLTQ